MEIVITEAFNNDARPPAKVTRRISLSGTGAIISDSVQISIEAQYGDLATHGLYTLWVGAAYARVQRVKVSLPKD